ncbi:hypothetical protein GQ607_008715 [Colletotrichum asianum]|uniref:Uncharacterized protein n=1 Tax=Colletotrichum asianum TaxID=702518 RepID=A0A8H3ZUI1_9PEZI|nr:hypothetical protein GQ607_008715 [Colletotrichum asianum]
MPWLSWDSWSMVQRCASESYRHFSRMRHGRTFHVKRTMPLETFSTSQFDAAAAAKRLHLDWLCRLLVPTTSFFPLCCCHVVSLLRGSAVARHASPARFRRPLTMRVSTRPNRPRLRLRPCPPTPRPRHTVKMAPRKPDDDGTLHGRTRDTGRCWRANAGVSPISYLLLRYSFRPLFHRLLRPLHSAPWLPFFNDTAPRHALHFRCTLEIGIPPNFSGPLSTDARSEAGKPRAPRSDMTAVVPRVIRWTCCIPSADARECSKMMVTVTPLSSLT